MKDANGGSIEAKLNRQLAGINEWFKSNKLSLNVIKSKYMIFHTAHKNVIPLQLNIENTIIEKVYEFNFLSLTINENLNWKGHVDKIANNISKSMGFLNKLKHFLPLNAKLLIYSALISSYLNFGILAWCYKCD